MRQKGHFPPMGRNNIRIRSQGQNGGKYILYILDVLAAIINNL